MEQWNCSSGAIIITIPISYGGCPRESIRRLPGWVRIVTVCVYSAHTSEPLLIRLRRPYLPICDKPPACLPYGLSSVTSREAWRPIYISSGALELLSSLVLVFFNIIRRCTSAAVAQSSPSHYMPYKETPEGWCTIETMQKFRRQTILRLLSYVRIDKVDEVPLEILSETIIGWAA